MSRIKGKDTRPELKLRKALFAAGFRYRVNVKNLPGKPDIVMKKYKTALFVHGCFWHAHQNCRYFKLPSSNQEFWKAKIGGNVERDKRNVKSLEDQGWNVIEVWECELKKDKFESTISQLKLKLKENMAR